MPAFAPLLLRSGQPARQAWPFAPHVVPLNHGSFGAVPSAIIERRADILSAADDSPVGWFPLVASHVAGARQRVSSFVGAEASDTAFVFNASAGATVVFNHLALEPGDEILVTDHGYGAVTAGAKRLASRTGAVVRSVPIGLLATDDEIVAAFEQALSERVKLIVVDQITSATARYFPTARIAHMGRRHGARTLVDGAHAPGLIPNAAAEAGADWWFGNLHKWACAPRSAALLVTRDADRNSLQPLIDSWGFAASYPERFDSQGTLDVSPWLTAGDSIEWIEDSFGWARARVAIADIVDAAAARIQAALNPDADTVPRDPRVPSMRLISLPGELGSTREEADSLRERLYAETRIESAFTSFRGHGYLRLSAHLYTTPDDIETFIAHAVPLLKEWANV